VETWRVIAGLLIGIGGVLLVLLTMAYTRERKGSTHGSVALAGAIAFVLLTVVCILCLTVFPGPLVWILVIVIGLVNVVLLLTS
jgi:hypothetical protein